MKTTIALACGIAFLAAATQQPLAQTAPMGWSGFYIGGSAGYGWGAADSSLSGAATSFSGAPLVFVPNTYDIAGTNGRTALDGFLGGAQAGYNFSSPRWIIGGEADIQFGRQSGSTALRSPLSGTVCNNVILPSGPCGGPPFPAAVTGAVTTTTDSSIDWFGTVRGRLGYLVNDDLLVFGTGGLAYGRVKVSATTNVAVSVANGLVFAPASEALNASKVSVGFALGAGLEGRLPASSNWSWKVEYLYVDLGALDMFAPFSMPRVGGMTPYYTPINGTAVTHTRLTENTLRFGLNYRPAP